MCGPAESLYTWHCATYKESKCLQITQRENQIEVYAQVVPWRMGSEKASKRGSKWLAHIKIEQQGSLVHLSGEASHKRKTLKNGGVRKSALRAPLDQLQPWVCLGRDCNSFL